MNTAETSPFETCQALMVALGSRRFVICRRDEPTGLLRTETAPQRVRDLRPGDEVVYKGRRYTVRSVAVYE